MHEGVEQQALGIDWDVALLALDRLSRIVAMRVNPRPPYMGRLKSSAISWCFRFFVPLVLAVGW